MLLFVARALLVAGFFIGSGGAWAGWVAEEVALPGRLRTVSADGPAPLLDVGGVWFQVSPETMSLRAVDAPAVPVVLPAALADSVIARGEELVARAWLVGPTDLYRHGVFGRAFEASALMIALRDGGVVRVAAGADAVFEDLRPRIVTLSGTVRIVLVRSTLTGGSGLVVIDPTSGAIVAGTPAIGHPRAWIDPVGVADFQGIGTQQIAVVRQPHAVGVLELWARRDGQFVKTVSVADTANHVFGSRALGMSAVADFDGDGHPDIAIPSLDRRFLRVIGFAPAVHEIARVKLPARASMDLAVVAGRVLVGLEDGRLFAVRQSHH